MLINHSVIQVPRLQGASLNDVPVDEQEAEWQTSAVEASHVRDGLIKGVSFNIETLSNN